MRVGKRLPNAYLYFSLPRRVVYRLFGWVARNRQ